jgi:hypothetical protein
MSESMIFRIFPTNEMIPPWSSHHYRSGNISTTLLKSDFRQTWGDKLPQEYSGELCGALPARTPTHRAAYLYVHARGQRIRA